MLMSVVIALAMLPLLLISRRIRRFILRQKISQRGMVLHRSRITGRILEIVLLQRASASKESDLRPLDDILAAFVSATGPIDSFTATEYWRDGGEQLKATEIKSKVFLEQARQAIGAFWQNAVVLEENRTLEVEPRGVRFTLTIRLRGRGTPRLWVRLRGDAAALQSFVGAYRADGV